jgi:hypothetical protein
MTKLVETPLEIEFVAALSAEVDIATMEPTAEAHMVHMLEVHMLEVHILKVERLQVETLYMVTQGLSHQ